MYFSYILFLQAFINGHLGCVPVLTTKNNATINMEVRQFFEIVIYFLQIYTQMQDCQRILQFYFLFFVGHSQCFPQWPHQFYNSNRVQSFHFIHTLVTFCLFYSNHSNRYEMILHCVLTHISLITNDVEYLFMYLWVICISSLEKCLVKSFFISIPKKGNTKECAVGRRCLLWPVCQPLQ